MPFRRKKSTCCNSHKAISSTDAVRVRRSERVASRPNNDIVHALDGSSHESRSRERHTDAVKQARKRRIQNESTDEGEFRLSEYRKIDRICASWHRSHESTNESNVRRQHHSQHMKQKRSSRDSIKQFQAAIAVIPDADCFTCHRLLFPSDVKNYGTRKYCSFCHKYAKSDEICPLDFERDDTQKYIQYYVHHHQKAAQNIPNISRISPKRNLHVEQCQNRDYRSIKRFKTMRK